MNAKQARECGARIGELTGRLEIEKAYSALEPVLETRVAFPILGRIGSEIGERPLEPVNALLERIAARGTMGGWVVIGCALGEQLDRDIAGAFARSRGYVVAADVWYGADILGERVPGPGLVRRFSEAISQLGAWRNDDNAWVRRTLGVAVHFWSKRSRGQAELSERAAELLRLCEPLLEEREMRAVKGVGWGLKTLGGQYPELVSDWLHEQIVVAGKRPRALMLRKATKLLSEDERRRAGVHEP